MRHHPVHYGVVGSKEDGVALVPWCGPGYAAFKRAAFTPVTTVPSGVECKHCKKGMPKG